MTVYLETRINRYIGASGDSKPDSALVGSLFYEWDTGDWYVWNGAGWVEYTEPRLGPTSAERVMLAQGLIAETQPRQTAPNTQVMVTQTVYYVMVSLTAGEVITNLHIGVSVAANSMTLGKLGIYSTDGDLLASTDTVTTGWESTGFMTHALTEPFTVLETGVYYFAALAVASTGPTLHRGTAGNNLSNGPGSIYPWGAQGSQSDLPSSGSIGAAAGSVAFWIGAS